MTTPKRWKCSEAGCDQLRAEVGQLCSEHRQANPPRRYGSRTTIRQALDADPRVCTRCDRSLPLSSFRTYVRLGVRKPRSWCRDCQNEFGREWKSKHRDELLARR